MGGGVRRGEEEEEDDEQSRENRPVDLIDDVEIGESLAEVGHCVDWGDIGDTGDTGDSEMELRCREK